MMCSPSNKRILPIAFGFASVMTIGLATARGVMAQSNAPAVPPSLLQQPGLIPQPTLTPVPQPTLPAAVAASVKQAVSRQFDVAIAQLQIIDVSQQRWPNGCLGLGRSDELCTLEIVPGYRVGVTDGVQTWFYRTDQRGQTVRLENAEQTRLPVAVANRLVAQVAEDTGKSVTQLRVTAVKQRVFDGCLGIYRPNQACTRIAIQGWQAIVRGKRRSWVYHLNQDASRIARNRTASGAKTSVRVSFDLFGPPPALDATVIFQRRVSGGLAGIVTTHTLTADGRLTALTTAPFIRARPILIKTLTPQQVKRFKRFLDNRRFPNLNGLSYLTSAALADYPTTTFQSARGTVQYIDLERPNLPRRLRRIIQRWERLIQTEDVAR